MFSCREPSTVSIACGCSLSSWLRASASTAAFFSSSSFLCACTTATWITHNSTARSNNLKKTSLSSNASSFCKNTSFTASEVLIKKYLLQSRHVCSDILSPKHIEKYNTLRTYGQEPQSFWWCCFLSGDLLTSWKSICNRNSIRRFISSAATGKYDESRSVCKKP